MRFSARIRTLGMFCVLSLLLPALASAQGIDFLDAEFDGVGGVDGLLGADAVAVSPDGKHVYGAAAFEAGISVFSRDRKTGGLSFVEAQFDGSGGVSGISSPVWISVSPDGANVYVSGFSAASIAVFERDRSSGALSFVEAETDGVGGVDGLGGTFGHAVSRDGRHVYVTGLLDSAVAIFERDHSTGALDFVSAVFDGVGGVDGIGGARSVALDPSGRHVYVAGLFDSAVAVFERDRATGELTFIEAKFDGTGGVDGLALATSVVLSPSGQRVYVTSFIDSAVAVFDRNPATGELTFVEAEFDGIGGVDGLGGVLHLATSPNGKQIYAPGFTDDGLAVFER